MSRPRTSRILRAVLPACCAVLAGCGGGDGDFSDPGVDAYRLEALPFTLDGAETELDLGSPDAVLLAALSALSAGAVAAVGDIADVDGGAPAPGRGQFFCDAGTVSEAVTTTGGLRTLTLTSDQCYEDFDESVQDGIFTIAYSQPAAGGAEGEMSFGFGTAPLLFAIAANGEVDFAQLRGDVDFEGDFDGSPGRSSAGGLQYFIAKGPRPDVQDETFVSDRRLEILAGSGALDFAVDSAFSGGLQTLAVSGPLSIQGSGAALDADCRFTARYTVQTNVPVSIEDFADDFDEIARGGQLTLSTSAGSATVTFDGDGNAQVDLPVGLDPVYTAAEVRQFCGL